MNGRPGTTPAIIVSDDAFLGNVREALENGYELVCANCGVGVYDDSDMHERGCPHYPEGGYV